MSINEWVCDAEEAGRSAVNREYVLRTGGRTEQEFRNEDEAENDSDEQPCAMREA